MGLLQWQRISVFVNRGGAIGSDWEGKGPLLSYRFLKISLYSLDFHDLVFFLKINVKDTDH